MPDIFTRVEDFLNMPLFEGKGLNRKNAPEPGVEAIAKRPRFAPGVLLNVICTLAGLASLSASVYWYSSAKTYQKLSADLAGELRIVHEKPTGLPGTSAEPGQNAAALPTGSGEIETGAGSQPVPVKVEGRFFNPAVRDGSSLGLGEHRVRRESE